jgi:PAS domain-containing protein
LIDSREEFKDIFSSTNEGLVILDLTGKILKVNKRLLEVAVMMRVILLEKNSLP